MKAQKRGGGHELYYLVAAAVGPNYSYAFLTVSPSLKTLLLEITHFTSHPLSHFLSHLLSQQTCLEQVRNYSSCHIHNVLVSHIIFTNDYFTERPVTISQRTPLCAEDAPRRYAEVNSRCSNLTVCVVYRADGNSPRLREEQILNSLEAQCKL